MKAMQVYIAQSARRRWSHVAEKRMIEERMVDTFCKAQLMCDCQILCDLSTKSVRFACIVKKFFFVRVHLMQGY